jgi:hypothetical protein
MGTTAPPTDEHSWTNKDPEGAFDVLAAVTEDVVERVLLGCAGWFVRHQHSAFAAVRTIAE